MRELGHGRQRRVLAGNAGTESAGPRDGSAVAEGTAGATATFRHPQEVV